MSRQKYDKRAYLDTMEALIQDWNAEIERFKNRAQRAHVPLGADYHRQVSLLRRRQTEFRYRLRELRRSDKKDWTGARAALERDAARVERTLDAALFKVR